MMANIRIITNIIMTNTISSSFRVIGFAITRFRAWNWGVLFRVLGLAMTRFGAWDLEVFFRVLGLATTRFRASDLRLFFWGSAACHDKV